MIQIMRIQKSPEGLKYGKKIYKALSRLLVERLPLLEVLQKKLQIKF